MARPGAVVMVITGIFVSTAATSAVTPAAASAVTAAARLPVAYGVPFGHVGSNFVDGKIRPKGKLVWTGDGSAWFVIHSYSSWTGSGARGSATVHARSCWGSCFRYKTERTTLRFYRVRTHDKRRYFTRLHFYLRHKVAGLGSGTLKFYKSGLPAWYY
jgi:hypothetical protein